MNRTNPCKERAVGCTADPKGFSTRCDNCRAVHNAREAVRREARRKECRCWVCGEQAARQNGVYLATCRAHIGYRTEVAKASA